MEYRTLSQFVRHRFQMTFYCSCNDFIIFHDKNVIHRFSICHATAAVRLLLLIQKKIISTAIITK